jgi:2-dehydropantoate 2-reductase
VRVLIAGAGGVGGYVGARLAQAGNDVTFLARGRRLEALRENGLTVRSDHGDVRLDRVVAVQRADAAAAHAPADALLFCVKNYDNDAAAEAVAPAVGTGTIVCSFQNGVESAGFLRTRFPRAVVLGGVARIESWTVEPGVIEQRGAFTSLTVGAFDPDRHGDAERLKDAFAGSPTQVDVTGDISSALWFKLLIIAGIGGVTAFYRSAIGEIRSDPQRRAFLVNVFREVESVASAQGAALPPDPVGMMVNTVDQLLPAEFMSSMCRDVLAGRPLEVEWLNGAAVRFGAESGIDAPANGRILDELLPLHRSALARLGRDAQRPAAPPATTPPRQP